MTAPAEEFLHVQFERSGAVRAFLLDIHLENFIGLTIVLSFQVPSQTDPEP